MVVNRNRRCARQAMVVVRSAGEDARREDGLRDETRRVRMRPPAGDTHHFLVLTPREARARRAAQVLQTAAATGERAPQAAAATTDTRRLLLAHAQRARHLLSRRELVDSLSRARRREMLAEIQRLNKAIHTLQEQIESTTRNVEGMDRLVFQLQRLTREFLPTADVTAIASRVSPPQGGEEAELPDERR